MNRPNIILTILFLSMALSSGAVLAMGHKRSVKLNLRKGQFSVFIIPRSGQTLLLARYFKTQTNRYFSVKPKSKPVEKVTKSQRKKLDEVVAEFQQHCLSGRNLNDLQKLLRIDKKIVDSFLRKSASYLTNVLQKNSLEEPKKNLELSRKLIFNILSDMGDDFYWPKSTINLNMSNSSISVIVHSHQENKTYILKYKFADKKTEYFAYDHKKLVNGQPTKIDIESKGKKSSLKRILSKLFFDVASKKIIPDEAKTISYIEIVKRLLKFEKAVRKFILEEIGGQIRKVLLNELDEDMLLHQAVTFSETPSETWGSLY